MTSTETITYAFDWEDSDPHQIRDGAPDTLQIVADSKPSTTTTYLTTGYTSKSDRRVAGNKRVAAFRETQGVRGGADQKGRVQILQSITATPGLRHSSFEELRVECYLQSLIARSSPPDAVDAVANPHAVIPPMFNALKDVRSEEPGDVVMQD